MKKLLFLFLLFPFFGNSQATFTAPVGYNTGVPSATPSGVGTRWRFDLLTGKKYTWLPGSLSWDEDARGIDQVAGCSAPLYTPGYNQSTFAVNACTVPELYQWTGAAWVRLNEGEVYTAGTGISINGSNVITNTSPNIVQTLSIAGQDLTLSGGGGTVAIPGGDNIYTADGTISGIRDIDIGAGVKWIVNGVKNNPLGAIISAPGSVQYFPSNLGEMYQNYQTAEVNYGFLASTGLNSLFNFNQSGGYIAAYESGGEAIQAQLTLQDANAYFTDFRGTPLGIEYADDYSATIAANPRSIPDVGTVDLLKQTPVSYTNAAAPNNCIFYSTTLSKLAYKDPGGTVNPLY